MDPIPFIPANPTVEDCWRGVVLYGRNTASYKFALASALLELNSQSGQLIKLEELAPVFAKHISRHLTDAPKQITTKDGKFIQACLSFNQDHDLSKLVDATVSHGFNNVIDAFHVVGASPVMHKFFQDERRESKGIRITDEFSKLAEGSQATNLVQEVEARWRLVETAWNLGISTNLLCVQHDHEAGEIFTFDQSMKRKSVTSSRNALNGYQKGRCFYCFSELILLSHGINVDVDHFFPHKLKQQVRGLTVDGVWNLVLSCQRCNRGIDGKFDRIPSIKLLERLHTRNEFFIGSHHP
jgi:HNH endonuclease